MFRCRLVTLMTFLLSMQGFASVCANQTANGGKIARFIAQFKTQQEAGQKAQLDIQLTDSLQIVWKDALPFSTNSALNGDTIFTSLLLRHSAPNELWVEGDLLHAPSGLGHPDTGGFYLKNFFIDLSDVRYDSEGVPYHLGIFSLAVHHPGITNILLTQSETVACYGLPADITLLPVAPKWRSVLGID